MTSLLWLRRDLRLHDHPALQAALAAGEQVVPVFCFDPRLLHGRHMSGPRTQFMIECLEDLDRGLRERGSALVIRHGPPVRELPALARAVDARSIHVIDDPGPFARARDAEVRTAAAAAGLHLHSHPGLYAVDDPAAIRTTSGGAYTVFTPFYRAWLRAPRREPVAAPGSLAPLPAGVDARRIPSLAELGLSQELAQPARGGERAAREQMRTFLASAIDGYDDGRNLLAADLTSRLSPHLRFGTLSPRELESLLPPGRGAEAFRRQLGWRDFYAQVLRNFPANAHAEHQQRFRGAIAWSRDEDAFDAWCQGRTGFPVIDAGMRQLRREGWMHNRARLLVGSFLTKDLGIDWRWGERWFMRLLLDGDQASNNGNWQWIASVGVDPAPAFRRILNPSLQQRRFDPDGSFVRRYVPELRDVPDRHLAEPWEMSAEAQAGAGCVIGRDYPAPIVDHLLARREALARYRVER